MDGLSLGANGLLLGALRTWLMPLGFVGIAAIVATVGLFIAYFLIHAISHKTAAIAQATAKEALAQPIFFVVAMIASVMLLLFPFLPYNTFGEDIKIVKDSGLTVILLAAIFVAVWNASVSVADEIEGRTALTLLSKPVGRRQFILGKFLGILFPVAILFIFLGTIFLTTISYKVVYDARETSHPEPQWQQCLQEIEQTTPGLLLGFFEAIVFTGISVAISTRLPVLPNLIICLMVYLVGHLTPVLMQSSAVGENQIVQFMGTFLATVFPVLDHFNIQSAIAAGKPVPWGYVGWAFVYASIYSGIAVLAALIMFEDRDLA
jgi:ABC-type transport system involved in multi-copper enzyme maturation permease subunit